MPSCSFNNGNNGGAATSSISVFASNDLVLNTTTQETMDSDVYEWDCVSSNNDCPFDSTISGTSNYDLQSNTLNQGSQYTFTMVILNSNFVELATCSINVTVYTIMNMQMK